MLTPLASRLQASALQYQMLCACVLFPLRNLGVQLQANQERFCCAVHNRPRVPSDSFVNSISLLALKWG